MRSFFEVLIRRGPLIMVFWVLLAGTLFFTAPQLSDVASYSNQGFLPASAPSRIADGILADITAETTGRTRLLLVAHRAGGLQQLDRDYLDAMGSWTKQSHPEWKITGSHQVDSADQSTAILILFLDDTAWSKSVSATVTGLRQAVAMTSTASTQTSAGSQPTTPTGLDLHVSGEAAFSYDEHSMVNYSMDLITRITIVVILLVLILMFRSPLTPLVPLSVIGLSFLIARSVIAFMSLAGFTVSAYTETFLIAVLFGAGTDYCLLIISRYREELHKGMVAREALITAMQASLGAILSSGGTVIIGFMCMGLASFGLFNATGPSVAIGVAIALLMVSTLTPAFIGLLGPRIFWPRHPENNRAMDDSRSRRWDRLASLVTRRPIRILAICLIGFLPFLVSLGFNQRSFDQLSELPASADSMQGFELMKQAFGQGEVLPLHLVIQTDKDLWNPKSQQAMEKLIASLASQPGIVTIRGATRPDGRRLDQLMDPPGDLAQPLNLPKMVIANNQELKDAMSVYLSQDGHRGYLDIVLRDTPYASSTLDLVAQIETLARADLKGGWLEGATVSTGGATAMFRDVRDITAGDFVIVMVSVFIGVFLVLVLLLRSLVAPIYLLLTILLSYASTMGITTLVFQGILGYSGVNWAVPFFAFVVLVALGVDYNIFLMTRVREEYRPGDTTGAMARALSHTGRIITSCGIIMAGTFSAMMVSPVRSIIEVGFATVVGLLIDTFIIRSLMVGAIATLVGELNWWPGNRLGRKSRRAGE